MSVTETAWVTAEQIVEITKDVWGSFLSMDLEEGLEEGDGGPLAGRSLTGVIHIAGEWQGTVFVECTEEHAQAGAEAMFAADPGSLSPEEVGDALGELTNMVGGNIKGLLPAPTKLSLPSVAGGESYTLRVPGALLVERVVLRGPAGPVRISLWRS